MNPYAQTIFGNGIMRVIGGMEGTNTHGGKEMAGGAKGGFMVVGQKIVGAGEQAKAQDNAKKQQDALNKNHGGEGSPIPPAPKGRK